MTTSDQDDYFRHKYTQSEFRGVPLKGGDRDKQALKGAELKPLSITSANIRKKVRDKVREKMFKIVRALFPEEMHETVMASKGFFRILDTLGLTDD